jgi:hypothetical protein
MDYSENVVPLFNGQNGLKYDIWSVWTKVFLKEHGYDIWKTVVTGYYSSKRENTTSKTI